MFRILMVLLFISFSSVSYAFTCFITVIKGSCWVDYNVTVSVLDTSNENAKVVEIIVPAGSSWDRQKIECQPKQTFAYQAEFTPVFWEEDKGKKYYNLKYKHLPKEIAPGEVAWNINICFPKEFSEVPLPPEAGSSCKCEMGGVPVIEPQSGEDPG